MHRQLTVQGWQNLLLGGMGLAVLAGVIVGAILMNRTDEVSREVIEHIQPARIAAYQLQAALRDQETAVRGYAIAADREFLAPYFDGSRSERGFAADIREHIGHREVLVADLDAIEAAAENWRTSYAEPIIAGVIPGSPLPMDPATTDRGKALFDELRTLFAAQNEDLEQARSAGIEQMAQMRGWRDRVLAAMVVAVFVTAILLAVLLHSAVIRPLGNLAEACRRITEGNFNERIAPRGPKDIRAIAVDVEDMRQRIVDELESSRSARAQLDEQAVELRRSNAELEQFAYVASHDLQEPLRKVTSFCQLLEKRYGDQLDERGAEYISFAVDGAKRMQVLINDLLTFSRVGRFNATHTDLDLDVALDAALSNLDHVIDEAGAEIERPDGGLPRVAGDPTLLAMLWQNL
ncbi:sensor histidine kinase, partial [Micromonospora sp. WMMD736]|uniref:sensor histidine kinase n=1 Tax=Micromonospora sp. WMMD736 TaxID=3404112 RepID=UPI003B93161C